MTDSMFTAPYDRTTQIGADAGVQDEIDPVDGTDGDTVGRDPGVPSRSYVVPCSSAFRDAVLALAARRTASAADLARAVLLLLGPVAVTRVADPGGPGREDREVVLVRSGAAKDRRLLRKPRLQVRLPPGYPLDLIRRALALALALDAGGYRLTLHADTDGSEADRLRHAEQAAVDAWQELARYREAFDQLRFQPLPDGVRTRGDALYVLGFPPHSRPSFEQVKDRFRQLAKVFHPDSALGDHARMAQVNEAVKMLRTGNL